MPEYTQRLGLPKPLGNETHNRAAHNALVEAIDQNAASRSEAQAAQQTADAAQAAAVAAQAAADAAGQTAAAAQAAAANAQSTANSAQSAAAAANQAIADHIAGSTAHPASAVSNTPAGNISATTVQAAINELDSEKAGKGTANTFTAKQTFAAGAQLGDANSDLIDVMGLVVPLDTHTRQVTAWDSAFPEKPKTIQIKDGSTVLATIDVTSRNSEGKVTQLKITQGARTRTWNITWTAGKEWPDAITVS